jgi:hypothetical protein
MEMGWRPLSTDWLRQAARFWAQAQRRPDGDLLREAMRRSFGRLAAGGAAGSWSGWLSECLIWSGTRWRETMGQWASPACWATAAGWLASSGLELPGGADELRRRSRSVPNSWSHRFQDAHPHAVDGETLAAHQYRTGLNSAARSRPPRSQKMTSNSTTMIEALTNGCPNSSTIAEAGDTTS